MKVYFSRMNILNNICTENERNTQLYYFQWQNCTQSFLRMLLLIYYIETVENMRVILKNVKEISSKILRKICTRSEKRYMEHFFWTPFWKKYNQICRPKIFRSVNVGMNYFFTITIKMILDLGSLSNWEHRKSFTIQNSFSSPQASEEHLPLRGSPSQPPPSRPPSQPPSPLPSRFLSLPWRPSPL